VGLLNCKALTFCLICHYWRHLWYTAFSTGDPFIYWGTPYAGINFTDDGMTFFGSTPGATPWINEDIPNAADPNNLLAMFWNDWEVVYDGPTNRGVSLANLGGTTGGAIIEYDDVQPYGDPTQTIDFEVFAWRTPDVTLGDPDIIFAYDNINLDVFIPYGTIGIENATGTMASSMPSMTLRSIRSRMAWQSASTGSCRPLTRRPSPTRLPWTRMPPLRR
jgi:hypothetical protein